MPLPALCPVLPSPTCGPEPAMEHATNAQSLPLVQQKYTISTLADVLSTVHSSRTVTDWSNGSGNG